MNYLNEQTNYEQEDWYYMVYKEDGSSYRFLRRQEALKEYERNGIKLDIVYKSIDRTHKTIIDRPNIDIERVRNDLSIKKTTKNQRNAIEQWNKANTRQIALKLNKNTDADILGYLEKLENKNGFIKDLIREHIEKENEKCWYILTNNQLNERRYKHIISC